MSKNTRGRERELSTRVAAATNGEGCFSSTNAAPLSRWHHLDHTPATQAVPSGSRS
jgi:hypothetical protein